MKFEVEVNLTASDPFVAALNNIAAAIAASAAVTKASASSTPAPRGKKAEPTKDATAEPAPAVVEAPKAEEVIKDAGKPESGPAATAATAPAEVIPTSASPSEKIDVATVRAAISKLAAIDKAKAIGILQKFGAPSVSALKEENYAEALELAKGAQ